MLFSENILVPQVFVWTANVNAEVKEKNLFVSIKSGNKIKLHFIIIEAKILSAQWLLKIGLIVYYPDVIAEEYIFISVSFFSMHSKKSIHN